MDIDLHEPVYEDLNRDGKADLLRLWWNGKRTVVVDEGGQFLWKWQRDGLDAAAVLTRAFSVGEEPPVIWNPMRAGWGSYLLLVDVDDDGKFGGERDFYYRAVDVNGDGMPEIEYFNASTVVETVVNVDGERDFKYLDFGSFTYADEQRYAPGTRYYQNVHGSGFFHNTRVNWKDISRAWETPIAWYDINLDGFTELVMRIADVGYEDKPFGQSGGAQEAEFAFELNGELSRNRWHSLDFQLTYTAYGTPGLPLTDYVDDIKTLAVPDCVRGLVEDDWSPLLSCSKRVCLPFIDGYKIATDFKGWTGVWMIWDEDNDDNRWEEMFSRHEADWKGYSDRIGDRVEIDSAFRGGGRLYVGAFDGRIHLYHADKADWNVDYYAHYKGSCDRLHTDEGPEPPEGLLHDIVRYHDTNGNGFIDRIEYGTAEYGREDATWSLSRAVDLLEFADEDNPEPDVQPLFDIRVDAPLTGWNVSSWDGNPILDWAGTPPYEGYRKVKLIYERLCARQWIEARMLYDTAVYLGLNRSEHTPECAVPTSLSKAEKSQAKDVRVLRGYASLADACSLREKYHCGYWLKEKVFLDILESVNTDLAARLKKLYYTGRISQLCRMLMDASGDGRFGTNYT